MSHYSVCVVVPQSRVMAPVCVDTIDSSLERILAPYNEQPETDQYLEFIDRTEDAKKDYERDTIDLVEFADGSRCSIHDGKFTKRFTVKEGVIHEIIRTEKTIETVRSPETYTMKLITGYPIAQWYSFEEYCCDYRDYEKNAAGQWGYMTNPNAKWDWYCIGGRFSGEFVVKEDNEECLFVAPSEAGGEPLPEGYEYADIARKRDVCWDLAKQMRVTAAEEAYAKYLKAFESGDVSELGFFAKISEEGIHGWGTMRYIKGETLEEFKARKGISDSDQYAYNCYAFVDADGQWHSSGDMGWFGISSNDKPERTWNDELQALMAQVNDDDFLVLVDCHI